MVTFEVPKARWTSFLDRLNRLALDRPVRLEVAGLSLGDQELGRLLPLRGIDLEVKGSERENLIVTVGSERGDVGHLIVAPTVICTGNNEAGELEWLAIEDRAGGKMIVYFEHPPLLEAEYDEHPATR